MAETRRELIFDLDDTLIDSAPDLGHALNQLLAGLGRPPLALAQVRRMIGDGAPELVRRALAEDGAAVDPAAMPGLFERYRAFYLATATASTRAYPGVRETLAALRAAGYRMVVCTNKFQTPTMKILDFLDLTRFFDGVVGGDVVPARKPDRGHLLAALALVDSRPKRAVMMASTTSQPRRPPGFRSCFSIRAMAGSRPASSAAMACSPPSAIFPRPSPGSARGAGSV